MFLLFVVSTGILYWKQQTVKSWNGICHPLGEEPSVQLSVNDSLRNRSAEWFVWARLPSSIKFNFILSNVLSKQSFFSTTNKTVLINSRNFWISIEYIHIIYMCFERCLIFSQTNLIYIATRKILLSSTAVCKIFKSNVTEILGYIYQCMRPVSMKLTLLPWE